MYKVKQKEKKADFASYYYRNKYECSFFIILSHFHSVGRTKSNENLQVHPSYT